MGRNTITSPVVMRLSMMQPKLRMLVKLLRNPFCKSSSTAKKWRRKSKSPRIKTSICRAVLHSFRGSRVHLYYPRTLFESVAYGNEEAPEAVDRTGSAIFRASNHRCMPVFAVEKLIVHRDLKLGNLFLSDAMEIKIGDFGVAAKLDHGDARRITLCGTPNYIAPKILDRKGHGFEADVWSLGCILYTLLIGRPPFQTSTVKETYERIKKEEYTIPSRTSKPATDFIHACLNSQPHDRPSMADLLKLDFFRTEYFTPSALPTSNWSVGCMVKQQLLQPTDTQLQTAGSVPQPKAAVFTAADGVDQQQQFPDGTCTHSPVSTSVWETNNMLAGETECHAQSKICVLATV